MQMAEWSGIGSQMSLSYPRPADETRSYTSGSIKPMIPFIDLFPLVMIPSSYYLDFVYKQLDIISYTIVYNTFFHEKEPEVIHSIVPWHKACGSARYQFS